MGGWEGGEGGGPTCHQQNPSSDGGDGFAGRRAASAAPHGGSTRDAWPAAARPASSTSAPCPPRPESGRAWRVRKGPDGLGRPVSSARRSFLQSHSAAWKSYRASPTPLTGPEPHRRVHVASSLSPFLSLSLSLSLSLPLSHSLSLSPSIVPDLCLPRTSPTRRWMDEGTEGRREGRAEGRRREGRTAGGKMGGRKEGRRKDGGKEGKKDGGIEEGDGTEGRMVGRT